MLYKAFKKKKKGKCSTKIMYNTFSFQSDTSQGERKGSEETEGCLMRALYDYSGPNEDDLCFKEGDLIRVMYTTEDGWAEGAMEDKYGYVPLSWLEHLP